MGEALGERIEGGDGDREQGQYLGVAIQLQHQRQRQRQQQREGAERLPHRQFAAGQRAVAGARNLRVNVAVGVVVDDATGGAHDEGAGDEYRDDDRIRPPVRRQPQRPQGRPQQQERADGPVKARQPEIGVPRGCAGRVHTSA